MTNISDWLILQSFVPAILFKVTIVLSIACLADFLLRNANPRWRVLLWRGAWVAVLALPLAERMIPPLEFEIAARPVQSPLYVSVAESASADLLRTNSSAGAVTDPPLETPRVESSPDWLPQSPRAGLIGLWAVVSLGLFATSLRDLLRLRTVIRSAVPAPERVVAHAREFAVDLRVNQQFTVLVMEKLGSPFVTGVLRPILVLPSRVLEQDEPLRFRAVLAHELAHIKSNDVFWMAIARVISCCLWFHPLAWVSRALHRSACEEVSDGVAAASVGNAEDYASTLAHEALALHDAQPVPAAVAMIRKAEIVRRIRRIHHGIRVSPLARRRLAAVFVATIVPLGALSSLRIVSAQQTPSPADFPHVIPVETYHPQWATFQPGDSIEILEVHGTASTFQKDARYYVRGRYVLASHASALLHVYATNGEVESEQGPLVTKGEGEFVRTFTLVKAGEPHVSYYPVSGGEGFGGTYFRPTSANAPEDPQSSAATDPQDWRARFDAVYRLDEGQVLKRIAPPFISERMKYYFDSSPGQAQDIPSGPTYMTLHWDGTLKAWGHGFSNTPFPVAHIIASVLEVNRGMFDAPPSMLDAQVPGDWIVRTSSGPEERIRAMADILHNEFGMKFRLEHRHESRPVVVVSGTYQFTPLPNVPSYAIPNSIHLYARALDSREGAGGGSGTLDTLLAHLANIHTIRFINEATPPDFNSIEWDNHRSMHPGTDASPEERRATLDAVLANVRAQTGLTFTITDRLIDFWAFVPEE